MVNQNTFQEDDRENRKVGDKLHYKPSKILGSGGNAYVFSGYFEKNKAVAVKRIQRSSLLGDMMLEEAKLMLSTDDHANIIRYYCSETSAKVDENFL